MLHLQDEIDVAIQAMHRFSFKLFHVFVALQMSPVAGKVDGCCRQRSAPHVRFVHHIDAALAASNQP